MRQKRIENDLLLWAFKKVINDWLLKFQITKKKKINEPLRATLIFGPPNKIVLIRIANYKYLKLNSDLE